MTTISVKHKNSSLRRCSRFNFRCGLSALPRLTRTLAILFCLFLSSHAVAQTPGPNDPLPPEAGISQDELQRLASEANQEPAAADTSRVPQGSIDFLSLLIDGGPLMIPIAIISLLVVTVTLERAFALRSSRTFPRPLARELRRAVEDTSPAVPDQLFDSLQNQPSAAARMLRDLLQTVGRPNAELESAINEGAEREADYLYSNVRWLTLAAGVTPLIGLLGTVWGMIIAFYETTRLGAGINKADVLAEGIYVALVTTLGGLAVAIPAAIFAHYFEGRITRTISDIEYELRRLVPRFESMEGKTRFDISARGITRRPIARESTRKEIPPKKSRPSTATS